MSRLLQCARSTTLCRSAQVLRASPQNRKYASVDDAQEEEPGGQPPVCIIGAGIAGCSVGHVLRSRGIPVKIFEKHLQHSVIKTKRHSTMGNMEPFAKHLSSNAQEVHQVLHKSREPFVRSNFFINLLQSALPIHFGHHVDEKRTFRPHNAWQPSVPGQQVIKNQRASFAVGSDGTFSDIRWHQESKQGKFCQYRFPTIVYASTVVIPHEEFLKNILPYLEQGTFANLERGGALLHVVVVRVYAEHDDNYEPTGHRFAHIRISYSRTASSDGWAAFYGHAIHQARQLPSHAGHDINVLREILAQYGDFGALDPPFNTIMYHALTGPNVNRKIIVDWVRAARQDLPTELVEGRDRAPCALVGDAAHAVTVHLDCRSPTQIVKDGVMLAEMIADAGENAETLRQVPAKFYDKMFPIWRAREQYWLKSFQKLHGNSALSQPLWIPITERANLEEMAEDELRHEDEERGDILKHFREKEALRRSIVAA